MKLSQELEQIVLKAIAAKDMLGKANKEEPVRQPDSWTYGAATAASRGTCKCLRTDFPLVYKKLWWQHLDDVVKGILSSAFETELTVIYFLCYSFFFLWC